MLLFYLSNCICLSTYETNDSRMDQVKFVEDTAFKKFEEGWSALSHSLLVKKRFWNYKQLTVVIISGVFFSNSYCFKTAVLLFHLLVLYIQNPPNYFVEKLHHTHYRGSDDDKSLCRILISRSEVNNMVV